MQPAQTYHDPAQPIEVLVGQTFRLSLEANPSTGYQWQLAQPVTTTIVNLLDSVYITAAANRPGASGTEIWSFRAVGNGRTSITLHYVRPWEQHVPPADSRTFVVTVQ